MWEIGSNPKASNQGLILEVILMEAIGFDGVYGGILTLNQLHYFTIIAWKLKHLKKKKVKFDALSGHKRHSWKSVNSDTTFDPDVSLASVFMG